VREAAGTDTEQAGKSRIATRERSDGFMFLSLHLVLFLVLAENLRKEKGPEG
jgi:hypothetical protein